MKIVFVSNFYNDHLHDFCISLSKINDVVFSFIECDKPNNDRVMNGLVNNRPTYIMQFNNNCNQIILNADVVIIGHANFSLTKERLNKHKITFICQERALRKGLELHKYMYRLIKWSMRYKNKDSLFLLCLGGYVYQDYRMFFLFKNRAFKFGYFPKRSYEYIPFESRENSFFWCGRLVKLKHPEVMIDISLLLNNNPETYMFDVVGDGPLKVDLLALVKANCLENSFYFHGNVNNEMVIKMMNKKKFYIISSDQREGWGASLNEAMSCGMICFASASVGSALYLIKHGYNGFIYKTKRELMSLITDVINGKYDLSLISKNAFLTIHDYWNGEQAAYRFYTFVQQGCDKTLFKDGIMSLEKGGK